MEGGLRTAENEAKRQDKGNNRASSRRLVFVGRLHTSATSPLMKASRRLDLGGISPIMGPRNPGGCYFQKKKAPARNAPVVVGIGGSIWVVFPLLWVPEIQGGVISGKKRPLPGMPRLSSELVFTGNPKFKEF